MKLEVSRRFLRVWQRNFTVYLRIWKISFVPPLLDPFLAFLAFGLGLGALVGNVVYAGAEVSYMAFVAPAIVSIHVMHEANGESTYAAFVRLHYQKTYEAILATPVSMGDLVVGEITWAATRAVMAAAVMTAVFLPFGLIEPMGALLAVPIAALGGLAFASAGLFFTSLIPSIDVFSLPMFLYITPMFLFSGTIFPLERLPDWARMAALCLPLTHLTELLRAAFLGRLGFHHLTAVLYLAVFAILFCPISIRIMRKRFFS